MQEQPFKRDTRGQAKVEGEKIIKPSKQNKNSQRTIDRTQG